MAQGNAGRARPTLAIALDGSHKARARIVRLRLAAIGTNPRPAVGGFPYPGRTQAEVRIDDPAASARWDRL